MASICCLKYCSHVKHSLFFFFFQKKMWLAWLHGGRCESDIVAKHFHLLGATRKTQAKLVRREKKKKEGGRCCKHVFRHTGPPPPIFLSTVSILLHGGRKVFEEQPSLSKLLFRVAAQKTCCARFSLFLLLLFFFPRLRASEKSSVAKPKKGEDALCHTVSYFRSGREGGVLVGKWQANESLCQVALTRSQVRGTRRVIVTVTLAKNNWRVMDTAWQWRWWRWGRYMALMLLSNSW